MLTIGTTVRYPGGVGTITRTSRRTGVKLYRVSTGSTEGWFARDAIEAV